jgi:hypothetical protein
VVDTFTCPCCGGTIGVNDDNELFAYIEEELPENTRKGLGHLRVEHSGNPDFYKYEPHREATPVVQPLGERKPKQRKPQKSEPIVPDEGLMKAAAKDLKQRNIH